MVQIDLAINWMQLTSGGHHSPLDWSKQIPAKNEWKTMFVSIDG